ncbi:MAG: hypothetical protein ACXITR_09955 [Cyanobacterium sp.]
MTKNATRGNNSPKFRSSNLEVSRSKSRRKNSSPQTKRYAVKSTVREQKTQNVRSSKSSQIKSNNVKKVSQGTNNKNEGGILKYLIVITCTIFTFGSLGFGYTLRYAHKWQESMVNDSVDLQNTITQGQEIVKQEMMKELRINR